MRKTAVELLEEKLKTIIPIFLFNDVLVKSCFLEAKKSEKSQILEAYMSSTLQFANDARIDYPKTKEQYYKETFEKPKS
jgi:hypothetical protein